MIRPILTSSMLAACALLVSACGGDDQPSGSTAPVPVAQSIDTAQLLAIAQKTSDTTSPIPVDGGLVTFNDTSETGTPISVSQ